MADDLGQDLAAVLLHSEASRLAQEAIYLGADKVYVVEDQSLRNYEPELYVFAIEKVVKQIKPKIVMMGQTSIGRDLAPRLAFRLGTAAGMDCVRLTVDAESKQLLYTRPVYGGKARAIVTYQTYPQITTIRARAMSPSERDTVKQGEVHTVDAVLQPSSTKLKLLKKVAEVTEGIKLEDAKIVVAGGRGIGSADGFKQLEELARMLKGALGATRPACDNGWVPTGAQIGLTAKVIAPELYIAVALSGSSQHMAGCSGSKNIVAINKDLTANVFKEARFGIVGDWRHVLPVLINKIKELLHR